MTKKDASLIVTADFVDMDKPKKDKPVLFKHLWRMYQETNDAEVLAQACETAPFFGQPEMAKEIARLLRTNRANTKYDKELQNQMLHAKVEAFYKTLGTYEKAYVALAEEEMFKSTQGQTEGEPKTAETLERQHKRWLAKKK